MSIASDHEHSFGQDRSQAGEGRTHIVIGITAVTMLVEIAAGWAFSSMALLADGLHMASHAAALAIVAWAYSYARRHAHDRRFSFGTGKVNALAGFSGALLLAGFSLLMAVESIGRLLEPVRIEFDWAMVVAGAGLLVNLVCALILVGGSTSGHGGHGHGGHAHGHGGHGHGGHAHGGDGHKGDDLNLRSAYLHVLADGVTSAAAILALLAGRLWGAVWMDPVMGIVGALLVAHWSWGLSRDSASVLLDHQAPKRVQDSIVQALEAEGGVQLTDLHVWSIGPGGFAAEIALTAESPKSPAHYRALLPAAAQVVHCTVEVRAASSEVNSVN